MEDALREYQAKLKKIKSQTLKSIEEKVKLVKSCYSLNLTISLDVR